MAYLHGDGVGPNLQRRGLLASGPQQRHHYPRGRPPRRLRSAHERTARNDAGPASCGDGGSGDGHCVEASQTRSDAWRALSSVRTAPRAKSALRAYLTSEL